jgi:hypothetical protein
VVQKIKESADFAGSAWNTKEISNGVFEFTYNGKSYRCSGDFNQLPNGGVNMPNGTSSGITDKRFDADYDIVKDAPTLEKSLLGYALHKEDETSVYDHASDSGIFKGCSRGDVLKTYQIYSIISYLKEMLG